MAQLLMQQYGLVTFKVRLDTTTRQPLVICDLEAGQGSERVTVQSWTCTTEDIGLPQRIDSRQALYQGYTFQVPGYIIDSLNHQLHQDEFDGRPLWLHLAKPAGYLPLVPWEQLLQPRLGVPMLRIPDFLSDPPTESPHKLEVVLCSSMPAAKENFALVDHLCRTANQIIQVVARRPMIHIFTDSTTVEPVRARLAQQGLLDASVQVYDPTAAAAYAVPEPTQASADTSGRIDNPWLLWMLGTLKGRSVDVVHFIAHAHLSRDQGALALAESPLANADQRIARFVSAGQLALFLTRLGAWSVFFSSPEHNYSEMGLRLLADTIAQNRPGPLVHHELRLDPNGEAIAEAYNFLFGVAAGMPPATPALLLYCHPARVARPMESVNESFAMQSPQPPGLSIYASAPELLTASDEGPPTWVAAAERYIEQRARDVEQLKQASEQPQRQEEIEEIEKVLKQIRDIVADTASSGSSAGGA
jgi:hypothetical protein